MLFFIFIKGIITTNKQIKMSNYFENVRIAIQELSELDCIVLKNIIQNTHTEKYINIKCDICEKKLEISETSSYTYQSGVEIFVCKDCGTTKCMNIGCENAAAPKDEDSDCWDCQGDNCNSSCF